MKKRMIIPFLASLLTLISVASFVIVLANQSGTVYVRTRADATSGSTNYSVQFGKDKNRFITAGSEVSGTAIATTENKASLAFYYCCVSYSSDCWLQFNNTSSYVRNISTIHSIKSISLTVSNKSLVQIKLNYYVSSTQYVHVLSFEGNSTYNFDQNNIDSLEVVYYNTKSDYVDGEAAANGDPIKITNMSICYLCS